jgi:hypothetical protein
MSRKRKPEAPRRFVYLIGHYLNVAPSTHINHTDDDPLIELARHNDAASGGMRETKRAAGHWRLFFFAFVPPERRIDTRELVTRWREACRTVYHRLMWGIEAAARLALVSHVNDEPLRTSEARAKVDKRKLDKVLARLAAVGAPDKLTSDYVKRRVERYVRTPARVLAERAGVSAPAPAPLTSAALDALNTLPPTKRSRHGALCLTHMRAKRSAPVGGAQIDALVTNLLAAESGAQTADASATARHSGGGDGGGGESSTVALVRELAALQQSEAFCDTNAPQTPIDALAVHAALPLCRLLQSKRRRAGHASHLCDALSVNLNEQRTQQLMRARVGARERACVCGAEWRAEHVRVVRLGTDGAPQRAHVCPNCSRTSIAYETHRMSVGGAARRLRPLAQRANDTPLPAADDSLASASSTDTCATDNAARLLLATFNDAEYHRKHGAGRAPLPASPTPPRATAPRETHQPAPVITKHASLRALQCSDTDEALANKMLAFCGK